MRLSPAAIRYLLAIYQLSDGGNPVRSVDIAQRMGVSPASVVHMRGVLTNEGLIAKKHYGRVRFTGKGARVAGRIYTSYVLIENFFTQNLGISDTAAREDAQACLSVLSEESLLLLEKLALEGSCAAV